MAEATAPKMSFNITFSLKLVNGGGIKGGVREFYNILFKNVNVEINKSCYNLSAMRQFKLFIYIACILLLPLRDTAGQEEGRWHPFQIPTLESSHNVVDIGPLVLDAPAGKHGFVTVKDGHFYFPDGTRARFWGTNFTFDAICPPKDLAGPMAERLAKSGYNLVRFHLLDSQQALFKPPRGPQGFNMEMLGRFDFFVHELRKRGIYYDINIFGGRTYRSADGLPDGDLTPQIGKLIPFIYPKVMELQKEYAKALLLHENPYTKLRYVDDPAMALLETLNENTLWGTAMKGGLNKPTTKRDKQALPAFYIDYLNKNFNQWLVKKYKTREKLNQAWSSGEKKGLLKDEDPAQGTVHRAYGKQLKQASPARVKDLVLYYYQLEAKYYEEMLAFLKKELGVQCPIEGSQHYSGLPGLYARAQYTDYIDMHGYWDHPEHPGGRQEINRFHAHFLSYVENPVFQEEGKASGGAPIMRYAQGRILNKPMTVSEWQSSFHNAFAYELPLIMSAYSMFHDWDAPMSFVFGHSMENYSPTMLDYTFTIANNSAHQILNTVAALAFHRQDVQSAPESIIVHYNEEDIFNLSLKKFNGPEFSWWGKDIPDWAAYVIPVKREFGSQGKDRGPFQLIQKEDPRRYQTTTGEVVWDIRQKGQAYVTINAPRFQALIGDLKEKRGLLTNIDIDGKETAAVAIISLEKKPLNQTKKALLVAVSDQVSSGGGVYEEGEWLTWERGNLPLKLKAVEATITLKGFLNAGKLQIYALDPNGNRKQAIPLTKTKRGEIQFTLGTYDSPWYELEVE